MSRYWFQPECYRCDNCGAEYSAVGSRLDNAMRAVSVTVDRYAPLLTSFFAESQEPPTRPESCMGLFGPLTRFTPIAFAPRRWSTNYADTRLATGASASSINSSRRSIRYPNRAGQPTKRPLAAIIRRPLAGSIWVQNLTEFLVTTDCYREVGDPSDGNES